MHNSWFPMPDIAPSLFSYSWLLTSLLAAVSAVLILLCRHYYNLYRRTVTARQHYEESIENLSEGFYRATPQGRIIHVNRALARMHGCQSSEELLVGTGDLVSNFYADPDRCRKFQRTLREKGRISEFLWECKRQCASGTYWVSENARVIYDPKTGKPQYYEGSLRDVTEYVRRNTFEKRLEKLAANLPGGLFQLVRHSDGGFSVPYLSSGFTNLLGLENGAENLDPLDYFPNIHPDDRVHYLQKMRDSARTLAPWSCEFRYFRPDGAAFWLDLTATPERRPDGTIVWHGHISDVSQRKDAEAQVRHLADFDTLTQLPNRRVFTRMLVETIEDCACSHQHAAVLFIDLDNFKTLNDTFGHELGDELLRQVSDRLAASARNADTVSRFGGDEFVLLVKNLGENHADAVAGASGVANKILREFAMGYDLGEIHHTTSASIGAVIFDGTDTNASQVIKCADIAMYEAKKAGRNRFVLFDPDNFREVSAVYALQGKLRHAAANDELFFEFQPVVEANGVISSCEALVRWQHPTKGLLSPGEFVPIAEKTGMVREINEWVLRNAIDTLKQWQSIPAMRSFSLAVNVSVQQLGSDSLVPELLEAVNRAGIDPGLMTLELTEHMMARNPERVVERMNELKAIGIRFSLDDFGTGYSSLSQLNHFPFDEVKIDGSFVAAIETSKPNRALIEAILGISAALGLDSVAEHVGSPFQMAFLKERGCQRFQGYFFHPPMAQYELIELITMSRHPGRPRLSIVN